MKFYIGLNEITLTDVDFFQATITLRTLGFYSSGKWQKARRGPVGSESQCITVTDWIHSAEKSVCFSNSPPHASSLASLLQSPCCELFFPATSTLPSHRQCRERTSNKSTWPHLCILSNTHPCTLLLRFPPGKTQAWHRCLQESHIYLVADAVSTVLFQMDAFKCCDSQHLLVCSGAAQKAGNYIYKEVFFPRWVGSGLFDVPLCSIKQCPECNNSHWKQNVSVLWGHSEGLCHKLEW